jgi:hypothetical protein
MTSDVLNLEKIADLEVSAASGLVALQGALYVIADDELFLAAFDRAGRLLRRVALFEGVLPDEHKARKRDKPDLEALTLLPNGALLALGSGSKPNRMRSVCVDPLQSALVGTSDWSPLFAELTRSLPELNIEGAAVAHDRLWLAQRGNGALGLNACIEIELDAVCAALARGAAIDASVLRAIHPVVLGAIDGAPLSLTDLCAHPGGGLIFSAAAEPSASTYDDAPTTGSAIGVLTTRGDVTRCDGVSERCKLEGIALVHDANGDASLWLVADPDDRALRAPLYRVRWAF